MADAPVHCQHVHRGEVFSRASGTTTGRSDMALNTKTLLAVLVGFATSQVSAQEPGFFIGASAGSTTAKVEQDLPGGGSIDLDEDENGFKVLAGYNFSRFFGIEADYAVLGQPSVEDTVLGTDVELEVDITSFQGFLVGTLPLGPFDVFGKVGGAAVSSDSDLDIKGPLTHIKRSNGNDDSVLAYGGGVALNFGNFAIRAEYEEYDADSLDDLYFVSAGVTYPFAREPEVVAPAPAPAPAPKPAVAAAPAKAADSDRDGVPDSTDQCPNTPAGARVGPGGCDCDYTLQLEFALNSAELTASDKAKIDQIIPVLKNPKVAFIAGEIDGYTDSTGTDAYNLGLSKR